MSLGAMAHPADDAWVVKVHASEDGGALLGGGVVLDDHRVLTSAHIAGIWDKAVGTWAERDAGVWVSFPNAEAGDAERRVRVEWVALPSGERVRDVAVLHLAGPPPASVPAAPLQCLQPRALEGKRWRALGFVDAIGQVVEGKMGPHPAHGWVQLNTDPDSRYRVTRGFSGSGLWSPDYQVVVAVIGYEHEETGDGRAVTLYQADQWLPDEGIKALSERRSPARADEATGSAWGWSLSGDLEGARHWRTSGRGVTVASEYGFRFHGRADALRAVRDWLEGSPPGRQVLVVTGAPGTGKSAVLGRIVTTADRAEARQLPASDNGERTTEGSVGCAVHAKGKTALDIAFEIVKAARAAQRVERLEDFEPALRQALSGHQERRFNVIIDALDEAATPAQARAAAEKVILPLARISADVGGSVVVGSRRFDADGQDLLRVFGGAAQLIDLDKAEFFDEQDLAGYVRVTLQLAGRLRPDNPFDDEETAGRAVRRIVALSVQNFLVAGLTARMLASPSRGGAVDPASLPSRVTVDDAMREFLARIPPVPAGACAAAPVLSAETLLTPLAFAEAPGLPAGLWRTALRALGAGDVPEPVLTRFAKSSPAKFLIESSGDDRQGAAFRLFHQALNEALLRARASTASRAEDEAALTRGFLQAGQDTGWEHASRYLLRSLPAHAARAGLVDDLLADDDYLLHADLRRLIPVAEGASSLTACRRARLLRLTPEAIAAAPDERVAQFSVTEALDNLGTTYRDDRWQASYCARWAVTAARAEHATIRGHQGRVNALCTVTVDGRNLLASGGKDGTVRLWDPRTSQQVRVLNGHQDEVNALCTVTLDGRNLLASGGKDGTVRLWDPRTSQQVRVLNGHQDEVNALCTVTLDGRSLLASGSDDRMVRLWDLQSGEHLRAFEGHTWVNAVHTLVLDGRELLVTGNDDETVRLLDLHTSEQVRVLNAQRGRVNALCTVTVDGRGLLATGHDGTILVWDPRTSEQFFAGGGHQGEVRAVCTVTIDDQEFLASGGSDGTVLVRKPLTGEHLTIHKGHRGEVRAVCPVIVDGRELLASGGDDGTVRLWNPRESERPAILDGHPGSIAHLNAIVVDGRELLASNDGWAAYDSLNPYELLGYRDGTVRMWDVQSGRQLCTLEGLRWINAICIVAGSGNGQDLLAVRGRDWGFRLWDPRTGKERKLAAFHSRYGRVSAVCTIAVDGRDLLVTGGEDGTMRVWDDPRAGRQLVMLEGNPREVTELCAVTVDDRELLASHTNATGAVQLWDPRTGKRLSMLEVNSYVKKLFPVTVDNRDLLVVDASGTVQLWDPRTGKRLRMLGGRHSSFRVLCAVTVDGRDLVVATRKKSGQTVQAWDLYAGKQLTTIGSQDHGVDSLCPVRVESRDLFASGSRDCAVRLWDPRTGSCLARIPTHYPVHAVTAVGDSLAIALSVGILVIKLSQDKPGAGSKHMPTCKTPPSKI
jgi:WD40 repeat protein